MLEPGDEVLILAPHWPLIVGIVRACRGVPVTVDVLDHLEGNASDAASLLRASRSQAEQAHNRLVPQLPEQPNRQSVAGERRSSSG